MEGDKSIKITCAPGIDACLMICICAACDEIDRPADIEDIMDILIDEIDK
jgi:hypothetical protein